VQVSRFRREFLLARHMSNTAGTESATAQIVPRIPPLEVFSELSKARLSALVVATAGTSYGFAVVTAAQPFSFACFGGLITGTFLAAACANTLNQWIEVEHDSLMHRTRRRPLPSGRLTGKEALMFAGVSGSAGVATMLALCNPLTAALGAANIFLYAAVYTPLKQKTHLNTWIGAVVGAIPPLMGWAAATGTVFAPGAVIAAGLLYCWQMPHFLALAYMVKEDYTRGGYKMLPCEDVPKTARVILRNCAYLLPITLAAPALGLCDWPVYLEATALGGAFVALAVQFRRDTNSKTARKLFLYSLAYLPVILLCMVLHATPKEEANSETPTLVCPHESVQAEILVKRSTSQTDRSM